MISGSKNYAKSDYVHGRRAGSLRDMMKCAKKRAKKTTNRKVRRNTKENFIGNEYRKISGKDISYKYLL